MKILLWNKVKILPRILQRTQRIASVTTKNPTSTTASPTTCSMKFINCKSQCWNFHHQNRESHNLFNASPAATIANPTTKKSLHVPQLSFFVFHNYHYSSSTKDLGGRVRSEEKGFHAVNSKQKSTKNLFLVGSFLTFCLAGPFCRNLLLSTKDLDDETQ